MKGLIINCEPVFWQDPNDILEPINQLFGNLTLELPFHFDQICKVPNRPKNGWNQKEFIAVIAGFDMSTCSKGSKVCQETYPSPSNSHHQDYYIFSREPIYKPSFVTVTGWGVDPNNILKKHPQN